MSGSSLKVVDGAGREIAGAIDDQPLRVQLELDIDPASAPDEITVEVVAFDGTTETITAERIDWGADRPLYQTELTTMDEIFSQVLEVFNPVISIAPDAVVNNGEMVHFKYEDVNTDVRTFDSAIDARYWFTQAELADRIGETTNRGINFTNTLRQVRRLPESEARDDLEEQIEIRLTGVRSYLSVLERATATFNNPKLYAEQQIRGAQYYMGIGDLRDAMGIHEVLENAKDTVHGHIISGVATFTLGGYQMLVQSTGVAQVRTMLTGEDEMGHAVAWDGRVTAFLDLVGDGLLQGAGTKFELDHLVTPTRTSSVDTRVRYKGPKPETQAPEMSIVQPDMMGMPPEAVRAAFRVARMHNRIPLVRPTNPEALPHIAAGHLPKPESLKSKTVNELDTLLGMQPESRALVALFDPKTTYFESALRTSGMSDADIATQLDTLRGGTTIEAPAGYGGTELWNATAKRFIQRSEEFNGSTGVATQKLVDAGEIRVENGLIVNVASGKNYTGDHDLFDFIDSAGRSVTPETYTQMVAFLESSEFRAQHGAHNWWDPQRSDFPAGAYGDAKFETYRGIYEKIIDGHKRGGEILIAFPPVGPPIAVFSGTAPGQYLGHVPGPWAPVAPGSSFRLPSDIRLFGIGGTVVRGLSFDDSVQDWVDSEIEFRTSLEPHESVESTDAFDAAALAAAARISQLDADLESDDAYDVEEFDADSQTDTASDSDAGSDSGSTDAFDAAAAAAASRIGQLDADLESDDAYDVEEFSTNGDGESSSQESGSVEEPGDGSTADGSEAAFDAMAAAAAMQVAAQDADLESDDTYDLDEFSTDSAEVSGGVPTGVWVGVLGAAGVIIVLGGLFFGLRGSGETVTAPTEAPVVQQAEDVTTPTPAESVPADPPVSDVSESEATVSDDPVPADSGDTSEVVIPASGQDPRAHITSVTPVTLADGTQGLIATFAQSWGAMPPGDLFSFFVAFDVSTGSESVMTGYEVHNGSTTPLGTIPMYILQDGSVVFGTGLPAGGSAGVTVSAQTGSWVDEATTQAVFANFSFDVAGGGPPFDMGLVVYDLLNQQSV